MSLNKILLIGRLGKDPELRALPNSNMNMTTFPLATDRKVKTADGTYEKQTDWHSIIAFDRLADIANQYLRKGKQVYIEGTVRYRKYNDSQGNARMSMEIVCTSLQMLGGKDEEASPASHRPQVESGWGEQNTPNRYQQAKDGTLPPQQPIQARQAVGVQNMPDDIPF